MIRFLINPKTSAYLRGLESEFGESTNSIRIELNKLEEAKFLKSYNKENKKFFEVNTLHPLYEELRKIVLKYTGIDFIIERIIKRLGNVQIVYLVGDYAKGIDSGTIDLIFIGKIDRMYLTQLIEKAETLIHRKIKYVLFDSEFKKDQHLPTEYLLIWKSEK